MIRNLKLNIRKSIMVCICIVFVLGILAGLGYNSPEASNYILGDVDGDGKVTLLDAKISLKAAVGISYDGIKNKKAMDVDKNGDYNLKDAKVILQVAVGIGTVEEILKRPEITQKPEQSVGTQGSYARAVLSIVNEERAKYGLQSLSWDASLAKAADVRARETETLFSHTRPNGSSCFTVLNEMNISYMGCGENIAYGQMTPQEVMNAWMNSEGHRNNILDPNYTKLGVGCYRASNGTYYWTQLFIYN